MATREHPRDDPRIDIALNELRAVIAARYPTATFDEFERDDPMGVSLRAIVDIEDTDDVMDLVIDQLTEIQTERGLPVYLLIEQPLERIAEQLQRGTVRKLEPLSALFR